MGKSTLMFEELEIEIQGLSNIAVAMWNAMAYAPDAAGNYTDGLYFLAMNLCNHRDRMIEAVKLALEERRAANE